MADRQRAGITGNATMRVPITGNVNVGGSAIRELRFMPRSAFPEVGRSDVLYIDTLGECIYYWNGTEYIALSGGGGGGTGDYNELSNKPQINGSTLTGNKTSANLGLQDAIEDLSSIRSGAAEGATAVQPASMETALSGKQDTISDLSDIRAGAWLGATAVQPAAMETALSGKQDTISDLATIRSGASAGATAVQPSALNDYQTKLSGTNKLDPAYIEYDATHRAVSDTEKSTWNGKQDTISDLSTIRSGAAAGATALQQSDVSSTYSASGTAPVNGTAVSDALGTLNVLSVGGSGKYISAILETNGKIEATPTTFDTTLSSSSTNNNVPTTKAVFDDQQRQDALEAEDRAALVQQVDGGAKNLFQYNPVSVPEISYIINGDGSITVTANSTTTVRIFVLGLVTNLKDGKKYTLSGISGGSYSNSYGFAIATSNATGKVFLGNGYADFVKTSEMYQLELAVRAGQSWTKTFYPMICTAADWAISQKFVPYRPSWQELTTKTQQNENNIVSLTANVTIANIISDVTMASGFTLEAQSFLYKQGKHIFGRLIISSTNAYTTSDVEPCTIDTHKPSPHYVAFCGLGADKWKIKSIGYAYISSLSGALKVNDSGNNSNYTANIPIDYVTE